MMEATTPAETIRYCEDCRHCRPQNGDFLYARCTRSPAPANSDQLVARQFDSKPREFLYCSVARRAPEECGLGGKHFEALTEADRTARVA